MKKLVAFMLVFVLLISSVTTCFAACKHQWKVLRIVHSDSQTDQAVHVDGCKNFGSGHYHYKVFRYYNIVKLCVKCHIERWFWTKYYSHTYCPFYASEKLP